MQYKVPVQIENEDPIFMGLSLRQLTIIMVWWGIAYATFNSLTPWLPKEIALIPTLIIGSVAFMIAVFRHSEMTFIPFVFALLRYNINTKERIWCMWVDSYSVLDIWYITSSDKAEEWKVSFKSKTERIKEIEDNLEHI